MMLNPAKVAKESPLASFVLYIFTACGINKTAFANIPIPNIISTKYPIYSVNTLTPLNK